MSIYSPSIEKLIENFELENRLNEEINEINKKIKLIHRNFLN